MPSPLIMLKATQIVIIVTNFQEQNVAVVTGVVEAGHENKKIQFSFVLNILSISIFVPLMS